MITVSNAYKTAVNADARRWAPRIEIYFDGPGVDPVVFDDVANISLLEESSADGENPLGLVSSNEIKINLDNSERNFTPTNTASPYYGKLKPNILIKLYLGLLVAASTYEYIPLGVFRSGDWQSPSSSVEASVVAYDKLYAIGKLDVPMIAMAANTTIGQLFAVLFDALGLTATEYAVGEALDQPVTLGYIPKGKVLAALQYLSIAGSCSVTTDRYGVIKVTSNFVTGSVTPVQTWTDQNQIAEAGNPQRYLDCYSAVKVNYKIPRLNPLDTILKIEQLVIPTGGITIANVEFSAGPVAYVEQVRLNGAVNSGVVSVEYGAWTITVAIANDGTQETVELEVIGQGVDFITVPYTAQDPAAIAEFGFKELSIDNRLIQGSQTAQSYAVSLLSYVVDPLVNFDLEVRGDPAVEVGDIVQIQDPSDLIGSVNVIPTRISLDFDGGLQATVQARKPIAGV